MTPEAHGPRSAAAPLNSLSGTRVRNAVEGRRPRGQANLFSSAGGSTSHMKLDFNRVSLERWRSETGQDKNSRHGGPQFVDNPTSNDYYTRSGSPARDAALNNVGASYCGSGPDIGFRESGC